MLSFKMSLIIFQTTMIHMLDWVDAVIQPNPHIIWSLDKMTTAQ